MNNAIGNIVLTPIRPNRVKTLSRDKDENYHTQQGRWCIGMANTKKHMEHIGRIEVNTNFYVPNKQWMFPEDINVFLKDSNNNDTNRIRTEFNMIQIMGNMYIGNAGDMSFNAKAASFSPMVKTRKEEEYQKYLFWYNVAKHSHPEFGNYLKQKLPIGNTEVETHNIFENTYVDEHIKGINGLLRYSSIVNRFAEQKKEFIEQLFVTGMTILEPDIIGSEYMFNRILTERFFWDRSSYKYDLSDAEFMGHWDMMMPTDIYERYNLSDSACEHIENFMNTQAFTLANNKVQTYIVKWRDCVKESWGYVKDEFGNLFLQQIDADADPESGVKVYTIEDVVDCKDLNEHQLWVLNKTRASGKAKKNIICDQWRYCRFIPSEIIGLGAYYFDKEKKKLDFSHTLCNDIVLEYGILPFQEPDLYCPTHMMPPYKVGMYMYLQGDVYSPIDIAINPQRMYNRTMSVVENLLNNARPSGAAYDKDLVGDDAEQMLKDMQEGKPVGISTKMQGITNVIGKYSGNLDSGVKEMVDMANVFSQSIEKITGINNEFKGTQNNANQLVGVMQLMIKRGTMVQERFYDAIEQLYLGAFQAIATSGKRLYIQNKKQLVNIIGEEDTEIVSLFPEMRLEDFRSYVKRSNSVDEERKQVDGLIIQFLQYQLLDQETASNLLGRASEDDLWAAVREFAKKSALAKQQAQQQAQQQQQEQQQQLGQQQQQQQALAEHQDNKDKAHDIDKIFAKGMADKYKNSNQPQPRQPQQVGATV